jgi:SMODS and SLOG-associating 2TM effector domain 1
MVCPWVGVMTTLAAAATAYGLLDRRQYLAGAYGAMVTRLSRVKELFADGTGNLPALVTATEDLLQSEHGAWVERTTQTITAPHPAASEAAR